jgi:hypothetical protein
MDKLVSGPIYINESTQKEWDELDENVKKVVKSR